MIHTTSLRVYTYTSAVVLALLLVTSGLHAQLKLYTQVGLSAMTLGKEQKGFEQSFYFFPKKTIRSISPTVLVGISKPLSSTVSLSADVSYAKYKFDVLSNNAVPVTYGQFSTVNVYSYVSKMLFSNFSIGIGPGVNVLYSHKHGNEDDFLSDVFIGYTNYQLSLLAMMRYEFGRVEVNVRYTRGISYTNSDLYLRYIPQMDFTTLTVGYTLFNTTN